MIIRIGNALYDTRRVPAILKLSPEEKEKIVNMGDNTIFVSAPRAYTEKQIEEMVRRTKELIRARL